MTKSGTAQRALRRGQPLWIPDGPRRKPRHGALSGHHETDVAIVGGGMTGALVAHTFASAGISTTVLEAGLVGRGSTAASSALLLQEPDLELHQLERRYGASASRRIWQIGHESVRDLIALLKRLRIRCDLIKREALYYATTSEAVRRLEDEMRCRTKAGFEATWLSPGELRRTTAIAGRGAILTRGSAQFDPYRACVSIVRAAAAAGAEIFERSKVTRIQAGQDGVRLRAASGTVHARRVIIATGYATAQFRPLAGRFQMYRTHVLATAPMSESQRREVGLTDVMVWEAERPYHYARWTSGHRLLLGGGDRPVTAGQRRHHQFDTATRELREHFETRLPALSSIRTDYAWEGLFAMTPDSLPYIGPHRRYPGHWFALGYGGNGMTFGYLAARLLLERWQGVSSRDHELFAFNRMQRRQ